MGGLKGQTGASTRLSGPKTKKEKADFKKYKEGFKRTYYTTYKCPNCAIKNQEPNKNHEGIPYCASCMLKYGKFIEMKSLKTYDVKTKPLKQKKNKRKSNKN